MSDDKGDIVHHELATQPIAGLDDDHKQESVAKTALVLAQDELLAQSRPVLEVLKENPRISIIVMVIMLNAILQDADGSVGGSLLGMPSFCKTMGEGYESAPGIYAVPPKVVTIWAAIAQPAQILGYPAAAYCADLFGRRASMYVLTALIVIGTAIEMASPNWHVWCISKFILTFCQGFMGPAVSLYISEMAPRELRAIAISTFGFCQLIGTLMAALIAYAFAHHFKDPDNKISYRGTLAVFLVLPFVVLVFQLIFLVESPYWLCMRKRFDDAKKSLRHMNKYATDEEIDVKLAEVLYTIEKTAEQKALDKQVSIWEIFKGSVNRRRTLVACWGGACNVLCGYVVVGPNATYFFNIAGQKNSILNNGITTAIGCGGYLLSACFGEKKWFGRWRLMVLGTVLMIIALGGIGVIGTIYHKPYPDHASIGFVVCVALGVFGFACGPGASGWMYATEAGSARLRAKTNGFGQTMRAVIVTPFSVGLAYMLASPNFGIKGTGWFFFSSGVCMLAGDLLFMPDWTGRSFAQIDELFIKRTPARKWPEAVCDGNYGQEIALVHEP